MIIVKDLRLHLVVKNQGFWCIASQYGVTIEHVHLTERMQLNEHSHALQQDQEVVGIL